MSGAHKFNFEPSESSVKCFVLAKKLQPSMLDISSIQRERKIANPQNIDSIINKLLEQTEQEVILPILRSQNEAELLDNLNNKIIEFYNLRHALISTFNIHIYKSKDEKEQHEIIAKQCDENIQNFFLRDAVNIISKDASIAAVMSIKTMNKVNEALRIGLSEDLLRNNGNVFDQLDIDKTSFDLFMTCLLRGLMREVTFSIKTEILQSLAYLAKTASTKCYVWVKKLNLIKYKAPKVINLEGIQSNDEDIELAQEGLQELLVNLEKEDID